ncbi:MAG: DoxX family protein [Gemmatimonadales bacterium]
MRRFLPVNSSLGLLLIRLAMAAVFLHHGIPKLLHFGDTVGFFTSVGLPVPVVTAAVVAAVEVGGALSMLLGIGTEITGILLAIDMTGAIVVVLWSEGFGGFELEFSLLLMALAVALAGPGGYALEGSGGREDRPH